MHSFRPHLLSLLGLLLLAACSSQPTTNNLSQNDRQELISMAKKNLGVRYRYGGEHPSEGFDCSGLVQYVHSQAGIQLPRSTRGQYRVSKPVGRSDLQAGDLVFFRTGGRFISHVGIYVGNSKFIHAPSGGKEVTISSLNNPYWYKHFVQGGRV